MHTALIRRGAAAILLLVVATLAGCKDSPETRRKQAQSNADKYWELIKANNPGGAYDQTFSENYKKNLDRATFEKFAGLLDKSAGNVMEYQVVAYDAAVDKPVVKLTYSVTTANSPDPLFYDITLEQQGSEWRISQVEPKIQRPASQAPPAPPLRAPTQAPQKQQTPAPATPQK